MREQLKWYDDKADNSPWIDALAELRQRPRVKAIASSTSRRSPLRSISTPKRRWARCRCRGCLGRRDLWRSIRRRLTNSGKVEVGAARTMVGTLNAGVVAYYQSAAFSAG